MWRSEPFAIKNTQLPVLSVREQTRWTAPLQTQLAQELDRIMSASSWAQSGMISALK
jgi:hypothetical protein